jgi:hypothetical protein
MTIEIKCRKLTLYSKRFFKIVVPSPSITRSGRLCSYLNTINEIDPMTTAHKTRHARLGSSFSCLSGIIRTITIIKDSMMRAEIQNHVALAIELSVMKNGIPLKDRVCNKSSIPTMKNKNDSKRILRDLEKLNDFHPYEKIENETAMLKNSRIVWIAI